MFSYITQSGTYAADIQETKEYADWILQVEDGLAGGDNDGEIEIKIPDNLFIRGR